MRYAGNEELVDIYVGHIGMDIRKSLLNLGHGIKAIAYFMEVKEQSPCKRAEMLNSYGQ